MLAILWVIGEQDRAVAETTRCFTQVVNLLEGIDLSVTEQRYALNVASLAAFEKKVGEHLYNEAVAIDRHLARRKWSDKKTAQYAVHLLNRMKQQLEVLGGLPRAAFGENNTLPYRLAHYLLGHTVPYWNFTIGRHWEHRFMLDHWQNYKWETCQQLYRMYGQEGCIREPLYSLARERLDMLRTNRLKTFSAPSMSRGTDRVRLKLRPARIRRLLGRWWQGLKNADSAINPCMPSPWETSPVYKAVHFLAEIARKRFFDSVAFMRPPEEREFATYFLHTQPEYSVEGLAFEFRDQLALIQNIAALLPANICLAVKEHWPMLGIREIDFYRKLVETPNVVLISDRINSYDLIRKSRTVFTLTGSTALEAIYEGVPAIVFGDVYFEGFEGIYKVDSIRKLKQVILAVLANPKAGSSEESAVRALAAMYAASYPGKISSEYSIEEMEDAENIKMVVDAIEKELSIWGIITPR